MVLLLPSLLQVGVEDALAQTAMGRDVGHVLRDGLRYQELDLLKGQRLSADSKQSIWNRFSINFEALRRNIRFGCIRILFGKIGSLPLTIEK